MDGQNWIVIATGDSKEGLRIKQMFEASRLSNPVACFNDGNELMTFFRAVVEKTSETKVSLPKMLILDLSLPGCEPLEIIQSLKNDRVLNYIPIVTVCNDGCMHKVDPAIELGASTYLQSKFTFADFFERTRFLNGQWTITR